MNRCFLGLPSTTGAVGRVVRVQRERRRYRGCAVGRTEKTTPPGGRACHHGGMVQGCTDLRALPVPGRLRQLRQLGTDARALAIGADGMPRYFTTDVAFRAWLDRCRRREGQGRGVAVCAVGTIEDCSP